MSAIWDLVVQGAPTGVGAILACLLAFYMVRSRERRLMLRARSEADKAGIANITAILASATDSINILRSALKRAEDGMADYRTTAEQDLLTIALLQADVDRLREALAHSQQRLARANRDLRDAKQTNAALIREIIALQMPPGGDSPIER